MTETEFRQFHAELVDLKKFAEEVKGGGGAGH